MKEEINQTTETTEAPAEITEVPAEIKEGVEIAEVARETTAGIEHISLREDQKVKTGEVMKVERTPDHINPINHSLREDQKVKIVHHAHKRDQVLREEPPIRKQHTGHCLVHRCQKRFDRRNNPLI